MSVQTLARQEYVLVDKSEAMSKLITPNGKIVTVIGNDEIRDNFEQGCLQQAVDIAEAPGIDTFVLNPDAHQGYGCPVGSTFASRELIFPCAVGPDVCCSMSFLQLNVPTDALDDKALRRLVIEAVEERIPSGPGNHMPPKARPFDLATLQVVAIEGASSAVLRSLDIPQEWGGRLEDRSHGTMNENAQHLSRLLGQFPWLNDKLEQLGGVGGGNHFIEINEVNTVPGMEQHANAWGVRDKQIGVLCHFGSRGFGFTMTSGSGPKANKYPGQFRKLENHFEKWHIPLPGGNGENVYAPHDSPEGIEYLTAMALGANFAIVNHLLVQTYILEAFQQVMGEAVKGHLVYHISHNIIRREIVNDQPHWVHRKGATRALPPGHHELRDTEFSRYGHPVLLPGNPVDGSTIMVGQPGSKKSLNSVNHGAGRCMSRTAAKKALKQSDVVAHMDAADIVTNCGRNYPVDEASQAYKAYGPVIQSVEQAGLAKSVAKLRPRALIKDFDADRETSA